MSAKKRFSIAVIAAATIIALLGAVAAITVASVGSGVSYAFWSEAENVTSTETSDTTALAEENNPSEKYIEYDYYVISVNSNNDEVWTRKNAVSTTADEDNIVRPKFALEDSAVSNPITATDGSTNLKAVVRKYTGNISTLHVPDATPVYVGDVKYMADVVEIAALNMETSPGVAIVDKLIIGRNVKAMGYSRGVDGVVTTGMSGFYSLEEVVVVRNGIASADTGNATAEGYYTDFDKIVAVGHFFEDSPHVERINALVYSNINHRDEVPVKQPITALTDVFKDESRTPLDFVDTGVEDGHALITGFKLSVAAIRDNGTAGLPIYKDTLKTVNDTGDVLKIISDVYTASIGGTTYTLRRSGDNHGELISGGKKVGRYEYSAFIVIITIYQVGDDGNVKTDELGIELAKEKYYI